MAVRTPSTGWWVRRGDLGQAPDEVGKTSRGACAGAENFQDHPRERFPKPTLVWPSGAAVQSALLKGDRWLGQLGVGSPRVLGIRGSQGVQEGRKVRPAEGVFIGLQASGVASTHPAPDPARERQPAP